jgi:hypothetical protein
LNEVAHGLSVKANKGEGFGKRLSTSVSSALHILAKAAGGNLSFFRTKRGKKQSPIEINIGALDVCILLTMCSRAFGKNWASDQTAATSKCAINVSAIT